MTIKASFSGASTSKPGTYPVIKVQNLTGFPLSPTGTVAIVGEAVGGEPMVLDELTGTQIQAAKLRYKSGPIADALGLLVGPSKDPRVPNGASKIIVVKTNAGLRSSKNLLTNLTSATVLVALQSKNWGADENNLSVRLTAGSILDANATIVGTVAGPYTLAGGETLILIVNGVTYTYTGTLTGSQAAAALVADLNTAARWSSSLKPVIASVSGTSIQIVLDPTVVTGGDLDAGYLHVVPSSTLDTVVGIIGDARGVRGTRFVVFTKGGVVESTLPEIGGQPQLTVKYTGTGTVATLTIQDSSGQRLLTTACTGAAGDNVSIVLGDTDAGVMVGKLSIQELADRLAATGKYLVTIPASNPDLSAIDLDFLSAVHCETVAAPIARDVADFVAQVNRLSSLAVATRQSNVYGTLKTIVVDELFAGAADGSSTNSLWANALDLLKGKRCNIVVTLLSADKGSVSIATVNALLDAHVTWAWSAEGRSPRNAYGSFLGTKAATKAAAKALSSGYTSLVPGDSKVFSFGQSKLAFLDPWATACIIAGMQAGVAVGEPTTYKVVNVNDYRIRAGDWDPKVDFNEMIDAGLTFLEPMDAGGFRVVVGNTTYNADESFVYNRTSVVAAAGFVYYDLVQNLEARFTGTKGITGTAEAIANFIKSRMEVYLKAEVIVGDDLNKGAGYKDLGVSLQGATGTIDVTITPVQGVDFLLPTIYLADVQQSA